MGDARDTAKKKKATEKKNAKGAPRQRLHRPPPRRPARSSAFRFNLDLTEPRSCCFLAARPRLHAFSSRWTRGSTRLRDRCCAATRLRVVSSTVKGCEGTAYCSSESSEAQRKRRGREVRQSGTLPEPRHPKQHTPIQLESIE